MKAKVTLPIATWQGIAANPSSPLFALSQTGVALLNPVNDRANGNIVFDNIEDSSLFTLDACKAILAAGGEIYNYPIFACLTIAKYAEQVPEGIPYRSYVDEDGDTIIRNWNEWTTVENPTLTNGTIGIPLHQNGGDYILGSEWITLDGVAGYTLVDEATYRTLRPTPEGGV